MINPQKIRPPHFILTFLVSATAIHLIFKPLIMVPYALHWFGVILFMGGMVFMGMAQKSFTQHETPVPHSEEPTTLVTDGLYKYSRNPMYVAGSLIFLGIALMTGTWPFFVTWVLMGIILNQIYIPWEERVMTDLFGDDYVVYKQSTRRWI